MTGDDPPVLKLIDFGSAHTDQSQSTLTISTLAHSLEFCGMDMKFIISQLFDLFKIF